MTNSPLAVIRSACIRANPEIIYCGLFEGRKGWQYNYMQRSASYSSDPYQTKDLARIAAHEKGRATYRSIHLSDVLLAMKGKRIYVNDEGGIGHYEEGFLDHIVHWKVPWNLRDDVLEHQTPETLAFLASLLGKE